MAPLDSRNDATSPDTKDVLKFLYEQRLILFNTRRGHEWEIIFRVLALFGVVDAALLTGSLCLSARFLPFWLFGIGVVLLSALMYELGVQRRNRVDRVVMDRIQDTLCACLPLPVHGHIRLCADSSNLKERVDQEPKDLWRMTYLWAFVCQFLVLMVAFSITALIFTQSTCGTEPPKRELSYGPRLLSWRSGLLALDGCRGGACPGLALTRERMSPSPTSWIGEQAADAGAHRLLNLGGDARSSFSTSLASMRPRASRPSREAVMPDEGRRGPQRQASRQDREAGERLPAGRLRQRRVLWSVRRGWRPGLAAE